MATTATLHPDLQRFPVGTTVKAYKRSNFPAVPANVSGAPQGSQDASATVASDGSVSFTGLTDSTDYLLYASVSGQDRYARFSTKDTAQSGSLGGGVYTGTQDFSGATVTLPSGLVVPADSVDTSAIQNLAVTNAKLAASAVTDAKVSATAAIARSKLAPATTPVAGVLAETFPRITGYQDDINTLTSQRVQMVAIVLEKDVTVNSISVLAGTTGLGGGNHQIFGLYDSSRALLRSTSDDTSTAWSASTFKTLNLTSAFTTTYSGLHYIGILVDATTVPFLFGSKRAKTTLVNQTPVLSGFSSTGRTTLPDPAAAITAINDHPYAYVS